MNKVFGLGINDLVGISDYSTGKQVLCPFYARWRQVLKRVAQASNKHIFKTYSDKVLCDEWIYASNFKSWMQIQNWKGLELDKDLLVFDSKIYSPETCAFIPQWLNKLLVVSRKQGVERNIPIGVIHSAKSKKNPYHAEISSYSGTGSKTIFLGLFSDPDIAHIAWQEAKIKEIHKAISRYRDEDSFRQDIENALFLRIQMIEKDIKEKRQTIKL